MSLLALPNELLCHISEDLHEEHDVYSFARVNKQMYNLTIAQLYQVNAKHSSSSALRWAATQGQTRTAEKALKARWHGSESASLSEYDDAQSTPSIEAALVFAAENNHDAMVRLLIENGARPYWGDRGRRRNAMEVACEQGHTDIVRLLLELGANARAGIATKPFSIQLAAMNGHAEIVRMLIDAGEDPDRCSGRPSGGSYTALQAAVLIDNEQMVKMLLAKGAQIDSRSAKGVTPLELAVIKQRLGIARLLLGAGAEVPRDSQSPALKLAAQPGREQFLMLLLENQAVGSASKAGRRYLTRSRIRSCQNKT
ncbi:uncharacterized protein EKO05_0002719 [Ascochyta rabiei]|uniref:Uncharacterized protein n=1 Tax=Didymella rabiei TaxID=5454 RepID=A0A163KDB0_DIDRA|nr:uncharacterized protein EKO05_0002719 [Ascochyta rabiei]KZM26928.1 hypothetical protein ST47_g1926 [Ascochyta rabiei]UPX12152.1 hypothetical protein EKO05_0002719 [Ascochyta rabiei]